MRAQVSVSVRVCALTCTGFGASSSNCCHCTETDVRAGWKALDSCDRTLRSHLDLVLGSKYSPHPPPVLAMALRRWWLGADLKGGGRKSGREVYNRGSLGHASLLHCHSSLRPHTTVTLHSPNTLPHTTLTPHSPNTKGKDSC